MAAARILVVEDSNAIRVPVATALSAQGFELASAADEATLNDCCHPLVRSRDLG
jgi:DNA-binding response OmpR family regulator